MCKCHIRVPEALPACVFCKEDIAGMPPLDQQVDSGVACTMLRFDLDTWFTNQLTDQQANDPELSIIYDWRLAALETGSDEEPPWSEVEACDAATKDYWIRCFLLSLRDKVFYRKWMFASRGVVEYHQLLVPIEKRSDLIRQCHSRSTDGHLGIAKTSDQVARRAYWHGWRDTVRRVVRQCGACAQYHRGAPPKQEPLRLLVADARGSASQTT